MQSETSSRPLRIALFTYSTKARGGVVHTLSLAEALLAQGHDVHIFALGRGGQGFFRPTDAPYTLVPFAQLPDDTPMDVKIKQYIDSYYAFLMSHDAPQFDIYHVQDCISANAVWRAREDGRLGWFVRTIHHLDDFTSPSLIECQDHSIYRPDHRIVVSRDWQRRMQESFGLECDLIHNGVDARFQPPTPEQRAAARAALGLGDAFVFLNIGGVEPRKNSIRLLGAFERVHAALAEQGQPSALVLAGGETLFDYRAYRDEFFALLGRSPLRAGHDVRVLGAVPDAQIAQLYHAADALAFPSVKEGWGLVALEALASGLPVLASELPVFHEYLRHGENALLADPYDEPALAAGLLQLAQDAGLRRRLAAAGPPTAQRFSWAAAAQAHAARYRAWLTDNKISSA